MIEYTFTNYQMSCERFFVVFGGPEGLFVYLWWSFAAGVQSGAHLNFQKLISMIFDERLVPQWRSFRFTF